MTPPPASLFQDDAGCSAVAPRRAYFFFPPVLWRECQTVLR